MRPIAAGPVLVAVVGLALAPAVQPQPAVPGARAELVQLDVVVTDAHGALVRDLQRDDFEVLEDGKPQRVSQFYMVGGAPSPAPSESVTPASATAPPPTTASAPPAAGRQIAIVVDDLHIGLRDLTDTKQAVRRLVDEVAGAQDNIALVTTSSPGVVQQFTRDRALLDQAIERLSVQERSVGRAHNSQMTPEQAALVLRGDRSALQLAMANVMLEPGSVLTANSPKAAVEEPAGAGRTSGGPGAAAAGGASPDSVDKAAEREVERQAAGILNEALRFSAATMETIEDIVRSLGRLPGRKLCVLVSSGFLDGSGTRESRGEDRRRVLDAATRSGTVVYTLDSRGLRTGADASTATVGVPPGLQPRVDRAVEQLLGDTLFSLADGTGGFVVRNTNDLSSGLRRMLADNDAYYLLAYEPTNTRRDGRFRKIEVRVTGRPQLTVRTRKGYFATDEKTATPPRRGALVAGAEPAVGAPEALAALGAPIASGGIPVSLSADFVDLPPTGSQVVVRARVDLGGLRWEDVQDRHRADLELLGGIFDAHGQAVGAPFGRRADLDVATSDFEKAKAAGLDFQQVVALPPGQYEVRMITRERRLAQQGGAVQRVEVPDLAARKLTMSGLFLGRDAPAAGAVPTGSSRRFKRGESVSFQFYVYNAATDDKGRADVVLQAQVWSAGKVIAASKPQPAHLASKDGVPVPESNVIGLEGLPPGPYELRVVVQDRKASATALRRIDFAID